jgi:RNA 3'-terminal phosphate cyclase-like protein
MILFESEEFLRQQITLATLTFQPLNIKKIRPFSCSPGIREYEIRFLWLIEKLTTGCMVNFHSEGTSLSYKPGVLIGGLNLFHDCGKERGLGYFLEPLVLMSLFARNPLTITLKGITNHHLDPSVDTFRSVTLPLLRRLLGLTDGLDLRIVSRGAPPLGGGEIFLKVPVLNELPLFDSVEEGIVKKIRGIAYTMKVSPHNLNRLVDGIHSIIKDYISDVFIFTDHMIGNYSGNSPGFGVTLIAETTTGCYLAAEGLASAENGEHFVPYDLGKSVTRDLLLEIQTRGVVDSSHQGLLLTICALGPKELNKVRLGSLSIYTIETLRLIKNTLDVRFEIVTDTRNRTILLSCFGVNLQNLARSSVF